MAEPSDDPASDESEEVSLDPDIEELLEGAEAASSDTEEPGDPDEDSGGDEEGEQEEVPWDEEEKDIEESTSWVEIIETEQDIPEDQQFLQCWGRFWGEIEDVAAALYMVIDPRDHEIQTLRLAVYGNPALLENFHPRMDAAQYEQRLLEYNVQGQAIPKVIFEQVDDGLRDQLEEATIDRLRQILEESDRDALEEWVRDIVSDIIQEGTFQVQLRARLASPEQLDVEVEEDESSDAGETASVETGGDSGADDSGDEEEGDRLDVSVITSPTKGLPATQLETGMEIFIRIVDERVEHLPDDLIEQDRSAPMSIPLEATIKEINPISELPEHIDDGNPDDYRELIVALEETIDGCALIYMDDRVKIEREEEEEAEFDEDLLKLLGLLGVLVLIILAILLF